jgi:hypothetical protein
VGPADAGEGGIKLYITQGEIAPYICLSYCWGEIPNEAKTVQSNLEGFQSRIPWAILPRTFQEAVIVTRRLGVRYLWIDSLCIIQGDENDWRKEASRMCSVYQGSTLTIFATDSFDTRGGLFRKSPEVDLSRKVLDGTTSGCRWEIHVAPDLIDIQKSLFYPKAFPLFSRAWVLQERLLSPCQLYFGASELEWKCQNRIVSENPVKYPSKPVWIATSNFLALPGNKWIDHWHEVIKHYTSLNLSFESDRLPAISGIAKRIAGSMNCDYLAGIWRNTLLEDLLWWKAPSVPWYSPRASKPLPPSWSWGSVGGPIDYFKFSESFCTIIECSCDPLGPDSFGQVISGRLTISGSLEEVEHIEKEIPEENQATWEPELNHFIAHSGSGETKQVWPDYLWYNDGYGRVQSDESVYLLRVAEVKSVNKSLCSLVLRRIDLLTRTYERIGILVEETSVVERSIGSSYDRIHKEETIYII